MLARPPFALRSCFALVLLSPSLALAATSSVVLPSVSVTASAEADTPPSTTTISEETLERREIRDFADLSRRAEPGVNYNRTNNSINIRGLDRDRIKTTIDGIRMPWLNDRAREVNGGLDGIDFQSLSAIDITRGADSSQQGSGALGGSIDMRTLSPKDLLKDGDNFAGTGKTDYDSADDSWGLNAAIAGRFNNTYWLLQGGQRRGHEIETMGKDNVFGANRTKANPADTEQDSLLIKLQQQLSDEHLVGITGELFERDEKINSMTNRGTNNYPNRYDTQENNRRKRVSLEHEFTASSNDALLDWSKSVVYWQDMQRFDKSDTLRSGTLAGPYGRKNSMQKEQYGLVTDMGKSLGAHNLSVGAEWFHVDAKQFSAGYDACPSPLLPPPRTPYGIYYTCINLHTNQAEMPDAKGNSYGVYIKDEISLSPAVSLTPGLRYDHYRYSADANTSNYVASGNDAVTKSNSDSRLSGSLLLSWQAHELATFYAQWAQGFKAPDVNELYSTFTNSGMGYARMGNPNLKPETSEGIELGARLGDEELGGSLSVFDNRYKNFIDTASGNPADYGYQPGEFSLFFDVLENREKVRIYGAEATAHWQFEPQWRLWSALAWSVGKDQDTKRHLNSVAPLTTTLGLSYTEKNYGGDLTLTAAQARNKVENSTDFKAPGYGVVDLTAYWKPQAAEGLTLRAGVLNLMDKKYWNALNVPNTSSGSRSTPQPIDYYSEAGRTFRASASWDF